MNKFLNLSKKSFAVYGLGTTGCSVIKCFKRVGIKNYIIWDDKKSNRKKWHLDQKKRKNF